MTKKRARTERRAHERALRKRVRDREQLAALERGGSAEHPIAVDSVAVIEGRARARPCPQCGGTYRLEDHRAPSAGLREIVVRCTQCHVGRSLWFRLAIDEPN